MKIFKLLSPVVLSLFLVQASAQTEAPKGFVKGMVVLPNQSVVKGFIKDNIRKDASLVILTEGKEKSYNGSDLLAAEIGDESFTCLKGDFFKVVSKGELSFLRKSSNASSKPSYNGTEVVFINGTEGRPGDYFIFDNKSLDLKLVSKKNLKSVINDSFGAYPPAIEKAKEAQGNIAELKAAVEVYNSRKGK